MRSLLRPQWPYFILMALVVIFLGDICFGGRILFLRDTFCGDALQRQYIASGLLKGRLAFWDPFYMCGTPAAAQPYTGAFYPPNWIFGIASVEIALRIWWVFHLSVAAIFFYLLCRHWNLDISPALFAAVSFAFSTYVMAWLEFMHGVSCLVWGPLVFLLVGLIIDRSADCTAGLWVNFRRNGGLVCALAVVLALQLLSSGEFFYYSFLLAAAYGMQRWLFHRRFKVVVTSTLCLGMAGVLSLALAMPQFVLTYELLQQSVRSSEVDAALGMASAHPRFWLSLLIPFLYGRPGYPYAYWAPEIYEFALGTCYVGILPIVGSCFVAAYFCRQEKKPERVHLTVFWVLVLVLSLGMAAGRFTPLYAMLHRLLPGLGHFRFPTKFFLFATYALAALGALGFQALLECRSNQGMQVLRRVGHSVTVAFGLFVFGYALAALSPTFLQLMMGHPGNPSAAQRASVLTDYTMAVVLSGIGIAICSALIARPLPGWRLKSTFVAVSFINLLLVSRQVQPVMNAGVYEKKPEEIPARLEGVVNYRTRTPYLIQQLLYGEKRPDIVRWAKEAGATGEWRAAGVYDVRPGAMILRRYAQMYWLMDKAPPQLADRIADMMSIRFEVTGQPGEAVLWASASRELMIHTRTSALPRIFITSRWRSVASAEQAWQAVLSGDFDPHREAVVELASRAEVARLPVQAADSGGVDGAAGHSVRSLQDRLTSVETEVAVNQGALLVLTDVWYPGWTAWVDGLEQPIHRANCLFRGVFLEPGNHHIVFIYRPSGFVAGLACFACGAAGCLLLLGIHLNHVRSVRRAVQQ